MNSNFAHARNAIKYVDDSTAQVTKDFARRASYFGTPEFYLWREYKALFPQAQMTTKTIKTNPDKENYRNMTYENMRKYIRTQENAKELMKQFEIVLERSKVQQNPYRCVLAWFKQTFKDYDGYKQYFEKKADKEEGSYPFHREMEDDSNAVETNHAVNE